MSHYADCVFCKIVARDIPAAIVSESEDYISFLDVGPLAKGHLLVVPCIHFERLTDLPQPVAERIGGALPKLGATLMEVTGVAAFNVLLNVGAEAGQVVPHVHFHLIPRTRGDKLGYRWHPGTYAEGEAADLLRRFHDALA